MCVLSGGKGRPTATPRSRAAFRKVSGSRRMSVRKKLVCDGTTLNPSDRMASIATPRASALSARWRSTWSASSSDAIAAPAAKTLIPLGTRQACSRRIVSGCPTAYPARMPAIPYTLEKVRLTRSRGSATAAVIAVP